MLCGRRNMFAHTSVRSPFFFSTLLFSDHNTYARINPICTGMCTILTIDFEYELVKYWKGEEGRSNAKALSHLAVPRQLRSLTSITIASPITMHDDNNGTMVTLIL